MNISPEKLRRISALPKSVVAEVLILIADIIADFEAQLEADLSLKTPQVEAQNGSLEAQNLPQVASRGGALGGVIFSSLSSLSSSESREVRETESTALIGKPSTRMPRARALPDGFEEFWKTYPKRINKQDAIRKFEIAIRKGVPQTRIIETAKRYANATSNIEKQFIKAPDVWLNKGCWDDEDFPSAPKVNQGNGIMAAAKNFLGEEQNGSSEREKSNRQNVLGLPVAGDK